MSGGSARLARSCFRLWGQRLTVRGHLRWPIRWPSITLQRHLRCYHAGQSCDCWVFVRVHGTQRVGHLVRHWSTRSCFYPWYSTTEPLKRDSVVKVLEQGYYGRRAMSSVKPAGASGMTSKPLPRSTKERLFIPRLESRGLSSPEECKRLRKVR